MSHSLQSTKVPGEFELGIEWKVTHTIFTQGTRVHTQCKTKHYQCFPKRKFNQSAISCSARVRKALWLQKGRLVRLDKCQGARDKAAVSDDI